MKRYLQVSLVSLVVATLLFRRQIGYFSAPQNRYLFTWSHLDAAILAGMVLLITVIGVGLYALVSLINNRRLTNIMGHAWIALLVFGIGSQFQTVVAFSASMHWAWMIGLIALLVLSATQPRLRTVHWVSTACLILSPLAIYTVVRVPFWKTWHHRAETFAPAVEKPGAVPVYIFSFDSMSWMYIREPNEDVKKILPNLRQFAQHSYRFSEARSSAPRTGLSLPMMAYQMNAAFKVPGVIPYKKSLPGPTFIVDGRPVPSTKAQSIFATASDHGYQSSFITFYLPWREILGSQCDYVHVYDVEPHGEGFLGRCFYTLFRNLRYYPFPNNDRTWNHLYSQRFSENWVKINHQMQDEVMNLVQTGPLNTLGLFHFPLPHAPFIFNPDGTYRGVYKGGRMSGNLDDYMRNTRYADTVFGKLVKQLKQAGKYDNALIIVTSDHGWASNGKTRAERLDTLHHNTLMIKLPGQTQGKLVTDIIANTSLRPVIQQAMNGTLDSAVFQKEIAKAVIRPKAPGRKATAQAPATNPTTDQ